MKLKRIFILTLFIAYLFINAVNGQEVTNDFEARTFVNVGFSPAKKLKLYLTPEFRFDENFSLDEYLLEAEIAYKPIKILSVGAIYRIMGNVRESNPTEYFNKYALNATLKKKIARFEPAFRLRYSNYADDEVTDKNFLRYKAKVKYDIANCKITPYVAAELFQQLDENEIHKMRYSAGVNYKLFKNNYIGLDYKFDYYNTEYRNKHIVGLSYKVKF